MTKRSGVSSGGDEMFQVDCSDGWSTLNIVKTIELYTLNGWMVQHVSCLNKAVL